MESTDKLQLFVQTVQSLEPSVTYFVLFNLKRVAIFPLLIWFCYILCYMYKILMLILFSENLFVKFFFLSYYTLNKRDFKNKLRMKCYKTWSEHILLHIICIIFQCIPCITYIYRWIQQLWLISSALNISFKLLWGWHTKWNSEDRLLVVNEMNSLHLKTFFFWKRIELLLNFQKWKFIILKTVKITIKILVGKLTIYYIWNMICINGLPWF